MARSPPFLFLLCIISVDLAIGESWESSCPASCECKYYKNKKVADCGGGGFSTIPSQMNTVIQVLDLAGNEIETLGKDAFKSVNLINLHQLSLSANQIGFIHPDAFLELSLLQDLDLSLNHIQYIHPNTFRGMVQMRKLILNGNQLTRLEARQFPKLPRLQHLYINNCNLKYVNSLAFDNLDDLTSVELQNNQLNFLQPELFLSRQTLKSVQLDGNPWHCDCNLRRLVYWVQRESIGESQLSCGSPGRVNGKKWSTLTDTDLSCPPDIVIPRMFVPFAPGRNVTVSCAAKGQPMPQLKWIYGTRVLTNQTRLSPLDKNQRFFLLEGFLNGYDWLNLTLVEWNNDDVVKCKVENSAGLVERNVTVFMEEEVISPSPADYTNIYIIATIISLSLFLIVLVILIIVCCYKRKGDRKDDKLLKEGGGFMERNNILIVNPVEKPPRKGNDRYESVPQSDIEMTNLSARNSHNYGEVEYSDAANGRVRSPLSPLEEEAFEQANQRLLDETTSTINDFAPPYPDLLDNVRFPRAISPTQVSYHSLTNPLFAPNAEWRYSYVHPTEYAPSNPNYSSLYARPGYVTLPRRPRTASIASAPVSNFPTLSISPTHKLDPIYDTMGPRTTADGTSRTDLRAMSKSMVDPRSGLVVIPISPAASNKGPPTGDTDLTPLSRAKTLPRSTPNLLDDKLSLLNDTDHDPTPPLDQKTEGSGKGRLVIVPRVSPSAISDRNTPSPINGTDSGIDQTLKFLTNAPSTHSYKKKKPAPVIVSNKASPAPIDSKLFHRMVSPAHSAKGRKISSENASLPKAVRKDAISNAAKPVISIKPVLNETVTDDKPITDDLSKTSDDPAPIPKVRKQPPKPPPKPVSSKRLSVSSTASDSMSQISSVGERTFDAELYQDEGPDGSEV